MLLYPMFSTLKKLLHKAIWFYIISGFATLSLVWQVFGQGNTAVWWFWVNAQNTDWLSWIAGAWTDQWDGLIGVIKTFINYALSFVSVIAFWFLVYGGYKMVASGGDEGAYKQGVTILKNAAFGIAFIAISWFLVTFIFAAIGFVTWS